MGTAKSAARTPGEEVGFDSGSGDLAGDFTANTHDTVDVEMGVATGDDRRGDHCRSRLIQPRPRPCGCAPLETTCP